MYAKQQQTCFIVWETEIISEAKLVHSNKGNGKGYLEEGYGDFKQWQLSHFIFSSEHLHPWYLQHAICFHKKFYMCMFVNTSMNSLYTITSLLPQKETTQNKLLSLIHRMFQNTKSPVTLSRSTNTNMHTMSFIRYSMHNNCRKLTRRLYFKLLKDSKSF